MSALGTIHIPLLHIGSTGWAKALPSAYRIHVPSIDHRVWITEKLFRLFPVDPIYCRTIRTGGNIHDMIMKKRNKKQVEIAVLLCDRHSTSGSAEKAGNPGEYSHHFLIEPRPKQEKHSVASHFLSCPLFLSYIFQTPVQTLIIQQLFYSITIFGVFNKMPTA